MKHPIKTRPQAAQSLAQRFAAYRRSLRLGAVAVLSVATVRAIEAESVKEAGRYAARLSRERKHDRAAQTEDENNAINAATIAMEGDADSPHAMRGGYTLTAADRADLAAAMGRLPRSLVMRAAPVTPSDEPLPPGYVPAPVDPYVPLTIRDSASDEEIAAHAEAVALSFGSELEIGPFDTSPDEGAPVAKPAKVSKAAAPLTVAASPRVIGPAPTDTSDHAELARVALARFAIAREASHIARRNARAV